MPKNVVFLVHGVGEHPEGWTTAPEGPAATLVEIANHYGAFDEEHPLTETVELVEIRYDDIFDAVLSRWNDLRAQFDALPEAAEVNAVLAEYEAPLRWFGRTAMDVIFYERFGLVRRLVQLRVAARIMRAVAERAEEDPRYVLVAHSLGTAVAHDALHRMGTTPWLQGLDAELEQSDRPGDRLRAADLRRAIVRFGPNPFGPGAFRFDAVFMLANTSALLHGDAPDPKDSIVRPMFSPGGQEGIAARTFFNVEHRLDPIPKVRRFRVEDAWPEAAERFTAQDIDVDHVHDLNVHGFRHYLLHPLVHAPLLAAIDPGRFTNALFEEALRRVRNGGDFSRWGEEFQDQARQERIERALQRLGIGEDTSSRLVGIMVIMPAVLKGLRTAFGGPNDG